MSETCWRIGGCLLAIGAKTCCCQTGGCDGATGGSDVRRRAALRRLVAWWDDTHRVEPHEMIAELSAIVENCRAAIDAPEERRVDG